MARRWWLLFRSVGVLTVLFLTPIYASQLLPWSYYLTKWEAVAELALEISAVLLLEAVGAAVLALLLHFGRALKLWGERADANCAGILAFTSIISCFSALATPVSSTIGAGASAPLSYLPAVAVIGLILFLGWRHAVELVNRLNQSSQIVLAAACPLLLVVVLTGGFGWRSFDSMPNARQPPTNRTDKPNVVIISFDALAAQDMSLYGYRLPTTPQFKDLARRSYNFVNFVSTADHTTPAVASLLTGQYPLTTRVLGINWHIPPEHRERNIAWILREHGYTTAAIVTNPVAHPLVLQLDDSFSILPWPPTAFWFSPEVFLLQVRHSLLFEWATRARLSELLTRTVVRIGMRFSGFNLHIVDPRAVFSSAEDFIRGAPEPYFLWVHLYPPHFPYVTDASFRGRFLTGPEADFPPDGLPPAMSNPATWQHGADVLRLRYDEEVAECDDALGQFLAWMAADHRNANTILVVTADHGENFSDNFWSHGSPDLHYPETHIPLLISLPGQDRAYTETKNADLSDVAPTILAALGIAAPSWMEGHPLMDTTPAASQQEPSYSMYLAQSSAFSRPRIGTIAANSGPYHLVMYLPSGRNDLFDISRDPEQSRNTSEAASLADEMGLIGDIRRRFCDQLGCGPPVCPSPSEATTVDAELKNQFALNRAQTRFRQGDFLDAEKVLREVIREQPNNRDATLDLGMVLASEHRYDEAIAAYRQAASGLSTAPTIHYQIARLLHQLGRDREARDECALALAQAPNDSKAQALMATLGGGNSK
ncbi:MAG TPA: sulfatase-like hydrolase/transferase [Candidatus Binataceae bacterium]|nr:sulfatase-like hydrolase/transferase [Candidatus Binataceae bacterium]